MGTPRPFRAEKLVVGVLAPDEERLRQAASRLEPRFGPPDFRSRPLPFSFTRYYEREMGPGLLRQFLAFRRLVDPPELAGIKLATNAIEDELRRDGSRTVNLDPGLLSLSRLALATTKESSQRIPLRDGIYAEVTLVFEGGRFRPLEWTYPDYRSEEYVAILGEIRTIYQEQLKATVRA